MKEFKLTRQGKRNAKSYLAEAQDLLNWELERPESNELPDLHRSKLQRVISYLEKLEALLALEFAVSVPSDSVSFDLVGPEDLPF
jgi:hypothetical protein